MHHHQIRGVMEEFFTITTGSPLQATVPQVCPQFCNVVCHALWWGTHFMSLVPLLFSLSNHIPSSKKKKKHLAKVIDHNNAVW